MKASVVIPTKNGGELFRRVLDAVVDQVTPWPYDILIVDSGSSDGTVEYCRSKGVRVHAIESSEFGHGKTRNLAISLTEGEFVALLTHDALPASRDWLHALVAAVEQAPDVAGAFGRHLPYPEADPYLKRDLKLHFDGFDSRPAVARLDDRARYERDPGYRQVLHFFSDNNACLRRIVWQRFPYPDVEFAEDQIWAKQIIEAGYGKAYSDKAAVYHSHSYSIAEVGRRSFDEAAALNRLFGYRMGPSLPHVLRQTVRCSLGDARFSRQNRRWLAEAHWIARAPLFHLARQTGYYLGTREHRLPNWMVQRISLDRALKAGRGIQPTAKQEPSLMSTSRLRDVQIAYRKLGAVGFAKLVAARIGNGGSLTLSLPQQNVSRYYSYMRHEPFGVDYDAALHGARTINWVIPDFGIGSGGHLNIFRLVMMLEKQGFECRICIVGERSHSSPAAARASIRKNFFPIEAEVGFGIESLAPAAITVATGWTTAYTVRNFRSTAHKCYFVQDYEPYFTGHGSEHYFARATYDFGFIGITAGDWLAQKLANSHGMKTYSMGFSYDRSLYAPTPRRNPHTKRVFFYARPVTPRRSFELGLLALQQVHEQLPETEFVLAGWDTSKYVVSFPHLNPGNMALSQLADAYSQCDAALVISATNLSLLPLELMACGCPVVSNNGPQVTWLLNDDNAVLRDPDPEDLAEGIVTLLRDDERRKALSKASLQFAQSTDWEVEGMKVTAVFDELLREPARALQAAT